MILGAWYLFRPLPFGTIEIVPLAPMLRNRFGRVFERWLGAMPAVSTGNNSYLVVSDLHLADCEEHTDHWKFFKSERFIFDEEFDALVARFMKKGNGRELTLILNGDIFDFDLVTEVPEDPPWPVAQIERQRCLDPTESKSIWKLNRILEYHPVHLSTLARFLGAGHKLVFIIGNHDRELHFSGVQEAFVNAVEQSAEAENLSFEPEQFIFEPWFYLVPGEIYVEHGQQYDFYTSFRSVLSPVVTVSGEEEIALAMGNLSNRYLMSRMGYFNPHSGGFILNLYAYVYHFFRFYAFTKRTIVTNWFIGSILAISKMLDTKRRLLVSPPNFKGLFKGVAQRYGLKPTTVWALHRLARRPISSKFFWIIREFWLDRLAMAVGMILGTFMLALLPVELWVKIMVPLTCFPLAYFIYEWFVRGENIFSVEKRLPAVAKKIGKLVDVQAVVFGHTHSPRLVPLDHNLVFVDTGTWAPITEPNEFEELVPGFRNYLWMDFDEEVSIRLESA